MLSNYLTSNHVQFKQDTNAVASWLSTAARECSCAVNLQPQNEGDSQPSKSSDRLKG